MITKIILAGLLLIVIAFLPQATPLPDIMNQAIDYLVNSYLLIIHLFPSFADTKIMALIFIGVVSAQITWYYTNKAISYLFGGSN